jgi:RHS repeat-associated protein
VPATFGPPRCLTGAQRLTSNVTASWDDAGRTRNTNTPNGATAGVPGFNEYGYVGGLRVWKKITRNGSTFDHRVYVHAGPNLIAEYNAGVAASTPVQEYVYADQIDSLVMIHRSNGQKLGVTRNRQWSVVGLHDLANGNVVERYAYDMTGKRTIYAANGTTVRSTSSFGNHFGYTNRWHDEESGLINFRARHYNPLTGEFLRRDAAGFIDGMSLYRGYFALNDQDPTGLWVLPDWPPMDHHFYPCHLGGCYHQPLYRLEGVDHQAAHTYFSEHDMGRGSGEKGRKKWKGLTEQKRRMHIMRSMKRAGLNPKQIRNMIAAVMDGATPGKSYPRKGPKGKVYDGSKYLDPKVHGGKLIAQRYAAGVFARAVGRLAFKGAIGYLAIVLDEPATCHAAEVEPLPNKQKGACFCREVTHIQITATWWNLADYFANREYHEPTHTPYEFYDVMSASDCVDSGTLLEYTEEELAGYTVTNTTYLECRAWTLRFDDGKLSGNGPTVSVEQIPGYFR